jgi:IstB-like ATP binding protein
MEFDEKSGITSSRMRPNLRRSFSTAAMTMVFPLAPRPFLPGFCPPMTNSSISILPDNFSRPCRIVQRRSFCSQCHAVTGALLDRLTHRCHILEANGESYRLRQAKKRTNPKQKKAK